MEIEDKYKDLTLDELLEEENNYYRIHGRPTELDFSINEISRARIEAFVREKGECYLAKFHLDYGERFNPDNIYVRYEGQEIYTFQYDFVLPVKDETTAALLRTNQNPENKGRDVLELYVKARKRAEELGGLILHWA